MTPYDSRTNPLCPPNDSELRMARGKEIASHPEMIEKIGADEWSVPSQAGFGRYKVWFVGDLPRCSCPDFDARSGDTTPAPCKHIYAVVALRLHKADQSLAAPERKPRRQYAQHPTYTKAQTAEMRLLDSLLRDLVADVPYMPKVGGKGGRPAIPLSDALYCSILKVYSGLAGGALAGSTRTSRIGGCSGRSPATTSPPAR